MKVVVCPHELVIGGCPINAIDLAAAVRDRGCEVVVYARRGPLESYIEERGLRFVAARDMRYRPAPSRILQLGALASRWRADVVHAYEWPPCLDAYFGAHLALGVPLVCTVLSMELTGLVPPTVPLVVGTRSLAAAARHRHRAPVLVGEPPIDVEHDHPANDGASFRAAVGVAADEQLVVTVSRLAVDLKLDALIAAVDAVAAIRPGRRVRLAIVGDGEARAALAARAAAVNAMAGHDVVVLTGAMADPRPAYAAADVVLGMGSSALRAMAHGRPVIVQGERGFARTFDEATAAGFLQDGFYGIGPSGDPPLQEQLELLLGDRRRASRLGALGRRTVEERFAIAPAADRLLTLYEAGARARPWRRPGVAVQVAAAALRNELGLHRPSDKQRRLVAARRRLEEAACVA